LKFEAAGLTPITVLTLAVFMKKMLPKRARFYTFFGEKEGNFSKKRRVKIEFFALFCLQSITVIAAVFYTLATCSQP
jgi:hypothetical protein